MSHIHPRPSAIRRFLGSQSSAGLVLMAAAVAALATANSPIGPGYATMLHVYARGEYWDERVQMMQRWSDYLDELRDGGKILRPSFPAARRAS